MRRFLLFTIAALIGGFWLPTSATAREFEDEFGRVINATLVSHEGVESKTVKIKLKGGKEMDLPIAKLSQADQKYVREWMKETPPTINYAFRIEAIKTDIPESTKDYYEVKVTNIARGTVSDLDIRVRTMTEYRNPGSSPDRFGYGGKFVGIEERFPVKEEMKFNATAAFTTTASYRVLGALVRVYNTEGEVVGEKKFGSTKLASVHWDDGVPGSDD